MYRNRTTDETLKLVKNLPEDIKMKIFLEYFQCLPECKQMIFMLTDDINRTQKETYKAYFELCRRLVRSPVASQYICKRNWAYNRSYTEHYIKHNRYMRGMSSDLDSFACSTIMWITH